MDSRALFGKGEKTVCRMLNVSDCLSESFKREIEKSPKRRKNGRINRKRAKFP